MSDQLIEIDSKKNGKVFVQASTEIYKDIPQLTCVVSLGK